MNELEVKERNLKCWAAGIVKELAIVSDYLTESEINVLQQFLMRCKERARQQG